MTTLLSKETQYNTNEAIVGDENVGKVYEDGRHSSKTLKLAVMVLVIINANIRLTFKNGANNCSVLWKRF